MMETDNQLNISIIFLFSAITKPWALNIKVKKKYIIE